jgi:hypothetical protein
LNYYYKKFNILEEEYEKGDGKRLLEGPKPQVLKHV